MRKDFVVEYESWREFGQSELQKWEEGVELVLDQQDS